MPHARTFFKACPRKRKNRDHDLGTSTPGAAAGSDNGPTSPYHWCQGFARVKISALDQGGDHHETLRHTRPPYRPQKPVRGLTSPPFERKYSKREMNVSLGSEVHGGNYANHHQDKLARDKDHSSRP